MSQQWPGYQAERSDPTRDPVSDDGYGYVPTGYGPADTAPVAGQDPAAEWGQPYQAFDPRAAGQVVAPYGQPPAGHAPIGAHPVYPVAGYPYVQSSDRSKMAAALLAFFLGGLGIHNFYLGHSGRGLAQLLISVLSLGMLAWVSGLWALIEFILILTGGINDAENRPLRN